MSESFEAMLTGGHPNSLGRTIEVVDIVLADPPKLEALYRCYQSDDEVVRLRVSNAMRRVQRERPDLTLPYMDRLIDEIGALDQPSAQWTLAKLFEAAIGDLSADQTRRARAVVKRNLGNHNDWIVLKNSIDVLELWAKNDPDLRAWMIPHLERHAGDLRKTVSGRAVRALAKINEGG